MIKDFLNDKVQWIFASFFFSVRCSVSLSVINQTKINLNLIVLTTLRTIEQKNEARRLKVPKNYCHTQLIFEKKKKNKNFKKKEIHVNENW